MINQYKEILKHYAIYGTSGMLARAVGFLMIPVYTRYLTPADYGVIELLDMFFILAGAFLNMGINASVFKFYYGYESEEDKKSVVSTAIILTFIVSIIFTILGIFNLELISNLLFKSDTYREYIKIILLTFLFDNMANIILSFIRVKQRSLLYSSISLARLFLGLSFNIYFIVFKGMGIFGILYSSLIVSCICAIILGLYIIKEVGIKFSFQNAKKMLRYGLPLVPSTIGMFIVHFGDRFFLQRYSNLTEVGLYSLGYKFGFLINILIVAPFALIWDAKLFEIEKREDAKHIYSKVFTYFTLILIFSSTIMTISIKDVIGIIATKEYLGAYKIVPFIAFAYVINGCRYMLGMGFYLKQKTEYAGAIMIITTIFTLVMYYTFIPPLGAMGAALATLISFIFWGILTYVVSQKLYSINYEWERVLKLVLTSFLIILFSYFIRFDQYTVSIFMKGFISLSFPLILLVFNFYTQSELLFVKERILKIKALK